MLGFLSQFFQALSEFLTSLGASAPIALFILFIVFLVIIVKVFKLMIKALYVVIASALFPIVMSAIGFPIAVNLSSILFFVSLGLFLFLVYLFGRMVYTGLSILEFFGKKAIAPFRKDKEKELIKRIEGLEKIAKKPEKKEEKG